jgi:signal transduction histidine kinase
METSPLILIADDQPDNLFVLEDLLSGRYRVEAVTNGQQVLDRLTVAPMPDLILLDVVMPGLDGFEVCRVLKQQPATHDVPVVFLTGLDGTADEERGLSLGADDFIHKPFVPQVVLARVVNLLGRREAELRNRQMAVMEARLAEHQRHADAMQDAVEKLTTANAELERITLVAAHDLREPLRAVVSFAQLLERGCAAKLDATETEYLTYVVAGAKRMYELVGGLLTYSQVTSHADQLYAVCAASACTIALKSLAGKIDDCDAQVVVAPLPQVLANEALLTQIFQQLIDNAVKFRHPDRVPHIEVAARLAGKEWEFTVTDNGIGFGPASAEEDVFELFRQLDYSGRRAGAGVGLAICKRIVHRLGGRIWALSTPGDGSQFGFSVREQPPAMIGK